MKKLFACLMAAFVCLASCAFAFVTPASAASGQVEGWFVYRADSVGANNEVLFTGSVKGYYDYMQYHDMTSPIDFSDGIPAYYFCQYAEIALTGNKYNSPNIVPAAPALFVPENPSYSDPEITLGLEPFALTKNTVVYLDGYVSDLEDFYFIFAEYNPFEGLADYLPTPSVPTPTPTPINGGIYGSIYDLITDCFYGENATLSGDQQLVATVLATAAIVFMFALPFLIVWLLIRSIGSWR